MLVSAGDASAHCVGFMPAIGTPPHVPVTAPPPGPDGVVVDVVTLSEERVERFTFTKSGLITKRRRYARSAIRRPKSASLMTVFALSASALLPALLIYIKPPMVSMRMAASPTAHIANL